MSACQQLWAYLKDIGFQFISMRVLNQDSLENFFGCVRQLGACNVNPTCPQFTSTLKTTTITNLSSYRPRGSNCEVDDDFLLSDLRSLLESADVSVAPLEVIETLKGILKK
jgi:hypothetical protein